MKWVEKGIVLYFRNWDGDQEIVRARLMERGIKVGSWAQDVFRFNAVGEEELMTSNDNALAQWEIDVRRPYSAVDFLKGYLEMCTRFGKRPDRPYTTAFVYADTEAVIEKIPKLPVVRRRLED